MQTSSPQIENKENKSPVNIQSPQKLAEFSAEQKQSSKENIPQENISQEAKQESIKQNPTQKQEITPEEKNESQQNIETEEKIIKNEEQVEIVKENYQSEQNVEAEEQSIKTIDQIIKTEEKIESQQKVEKEELTTKIEQVIKPEKNDESSQNNEKEQITEGQNKQNDDIEKYALDEENRTKIGYEQNTELQTNILQQDQLNKVIQMPEPPRNKFQENLKELSIENNFRYTKKPIFSEEYVPRFNFDEIHQQNQDNMNDNISMMTSVSNEKKRENFSMLRDYDAKRNFFLQTHRSLLEAVMGKVDISIQQSQHFMLVIMKYFMQKAQQELNYSRTPLVRTDSLFKNNVFYTKLYDNLGVAVSNIEQDNIEHLKRVDKFANFINEQVLNQQLRKNSEEFVKQIEICRSNLHSLKRTLTIANGKVTKKLNKLEQAYVDQAKYGMKKYSYSDLYSLQLSFLRKSEEQKELQRILAKQTMGFWKSAIELEEKRSKVYQESLELFNQAFEECYGKLDNLNKTKELLKKQNEKKNVDDIFGVNIILSEEEQSFIKQELRKEVLSLEDCCLFFENFMIDKFDDRLLILKDTKCFRETMRGIQILQVESRLIFSCDGYINVFDNKQYNQQNIYLPKPDVRLRFKDYEFKIIDPVTIKLLQKTTILQDLMNARESLILRFRNSDEGEEFISLINSF